MSKVKNILIIRLSSLGDVLLTTPVIRAIKTKYPHSKLHFLVRGEFFDCLKYYPSLNNIIELKKEDNIEEVVANLKQLDIDYVIDLQNNFRSRKIVKGLGVKTEKYVKPSLKKFLLAKLGINLYKNIKSIPEMYVAYIPEVTLDEKGLEIFLPVEEVPSENDKKNLIGFCVGAKHFTKRWPGEYFVELGNRLLEKGFDVIILGGAEENDLCNEVASKIPGSINPLHKNNLFEIAVDIKKCKMVFCNDSGLMHLTTALNVPVITFFGSSVREFGFAPYKSQNLILENNSLSCRPCSHIGRGKCPKKHFDCMKTISPDVAVKEFDKFIREI